MKRVLIKDIMALFKKYGLDKRFQHRFFRSYDKDNKCFIACSSLNEKIDTKIKEILKDSNYILIELDRKYLYEVKYDNTKIN